MNAFDADVVIGFLDRSNPLHARAVDLLVGREGEPLVMHGITIAEVLAGPTHTGRAAADHVLASVRRVGVTEAGGTEGLLEVALLRAATGLPISDCLVVLAAGPPGGGTRILTFDERLATKARELGHTVLP